MEAEQNGRRDDDGGAQESARVQPSRPEPKKQPVRRAEIGGASAATPQNRQLMFEQEVCRCSKERVRSKPKITY